MGDTEASLADFIEDEHTRQPDQLTARKIMKEDLRARRSTGCRSANGRSSSCATG